ncbi:hypothetical protein DENIS_5024 [Desulfonema ishimotonii]|uniref:DUF4435 domain-containing protein n=1 Tax=Desulfonema ishimotonii TaxID=45657 RepID=A0A401G483_9BACT|nr:DUF3226 domain-containing protein [Desulfonema ishimotonii]GBC64024.1 hypothetical protein DENIS_5024 [Desulfonema ishimotonii]
MMIEQVPKILLVEGIDDKKVIEKLFQRRKIVFEDFAVHNCEGLEKLLKILPTQIMAGSYDVMGVIADADEDADQRWRTLRNILTGAGYENVPGVPDAGGVILEDPDEELPKIGVWLMPDNRIDGAVEDFIRLLIPEGDALLPIAEKKVENLIAGKLNRFSVSHRSKALIHTWLAWQERPGKQLGSAITYRFVRTQAYLLDDGRAGCFVRWLKELFR